MRTALFESKDLAVDLVAVSDAAKFAVELHTGAYANAAAEFSAEGEMETLRQASQQVRASGLTLLAGHGLTYRNVRPVSQIPDMCELNIGHSIISRAIMVGLEQAVRDMKHLIG